MTTSGWKEPREVDREPEGEGFLNRWVKRKAEARDGILDPAEPSEATDPAELPEPTQASQGQVPAEAPGREPPERSDDDMPALDSLDQDSDYSPFLSRGVSPKLRQTALRQLFRQPKFNVETCLDDFQDDFLNFQPLGDIVTADMRHMAEVELKREATRAARAEEDKPPSVHGPIAEEQTDAEVDGAAHDEHARGGDVVEADPRAEIGSEAPLRPDGPSSSDDQNRMKG